MRSSVSSVPVAESARHSYRIPPWTSANGRDRSEAQSVACRFSDEPVSASRPSIGAEGEYGVLDRSGARRDVRPIMENISRRVDRVTEEVSPHVLELNFQHGDESTLFDDFVRSQLGLFDALEAEGCHALPFGMIPLSGEAEARERLWESLATHPFSHYRWLMERDGFATLSQLEGMCGLQIHTEERHGPSALAVARGLSYAAPYFAGLAASSPVRDGAYRGIASERLRAKADMALSGLAPAHALADMEGFRRELDESARVRRSVEPGYFLVRLPRVRLGTVENCAMDMVPDLPLARTLFRLDALLARRLADCARSSESLPVELFGDGSLAGDDRGRVMGALDTALSAPRLYDARVSTPTGGVRPFREQLRDLAAWAGADDRLLSEIDTWLYRGTVAERVVRSLGLDPVRASSEPVAIPDARSLDAYLAVSDEYRASLRDAVTA